jgi:orotidine-5'-phosphate decarboxylase
MTALAQTHGCLVKFKERLLKASRANRSLLCVGLDFEMNSVPAHIREMDFPILSFNEKIIEATRDLVCAYKPNIAFYEKHGERGITMLRKTVEMIPEEIPVILDCKRGDIGSTAKAYAEAYFDDLGVDAVTVNPYLGQDSIEPFLNYEDRGVFVVCRTTNPGAADFQDLLVNGTPLYELVARKALTWNQHDNIGLVAPSTMPKALQTIRRAAGPNIPILVPGLGAQGGTVTNAIQNGANLRGEMAILNAARSILYASDGEDFAQAARRAAEKLRLEINDARNVSVAP